MPYHPIDKTEKTLLKFGGVLVLLFAVLLFLKNCVE